MPTIGQWPRIALGLVFFLPAVAQAVPIELHPEIDDSVDFERTITLDNGLDVSTGPNGEWIGTDVQGNSFSIKALNQSSQFLVIGMGGPG